MLSSACRSLFAHSIYIYNAIISQPYKEVVVVNKHIWHSWSSTIVSYPNLKLHICGWREHHLYVKSTEQYEINTHMCACCSVINVCIWAAAPFCAMIMICCWLACMIMICCWLACMALHGTSARLYNMAKQSQRSRMLPSDADYLYFDALPSKFDGFVNNRARFIWNISRAHHSVPSTFWHVKPQRSFNILACETLNYW